MGGEQLTRTGEYLGTPRFIAPERVSGGTDDGRSDVFSLGALLYELVCATSPWTKEQERQLAAGLVLDAHPRPMRQFRRNAPPELEKHVQQALAWDAAQRPTAEDIAASLAALAPTLDNTPVYPGGARPLDADDTSVLPAAKWPG